MPRQYGKLMVLSPRRSTSGIQRARNANTTTGVSKKMCDESRTWSGVSPVCAFGGLIRHDEIGMRIEFAVNNTTTAMTARMTRLQAVNGIRGRRSKLEEYLLMYEVEV